uniref:Major facilitator superfamily (MFS) profile domain-containing protein n=1 Tax=Zea mays TaxID=4577 RepID=A0A804M6H9_MAIZE
MHYAPLAAAAKHGPPLLFWGREAAALAGGVVLGEGEGDARRGTAAEGGRRVLVGWAPVILPPVLHFVVLFGGSLLAYRVADFLGRRKELITAAALYIFGALVSGVAPDYFSLLRGRSLYGIGIGLETIFWGQLAIHILKLRNTTFIDTNI